MEEIKHTNNPKYKDNLIVALTFKFALKIIGYTQHLQNNKNFVLSNQLLKSGTSIGANVREAQNAESKQDFIHKIKISLKEVDETEYWLLLCQHIDKSETIEELLTELWTITKILNKIISTSKNNTIR